MTTDKNTSNVSSSPVSVPGPLAATWMGPVAIATGLLVLALGLTHPVFRDVESFLTGDVALPIGIAVALFIVGFSNGRPFSRAARWGALAIAGQGAFLALINAGNMVSYQHLRSWPDLLAGVGGFAFLLLLGQAVALGVWGRDALAAATRGTIRAWGPTRTLVLGAIFILTSATLSQNPAIYAGELALASVIQGLLLWTVAMVGWSCDEGQVVDLKERAGHWLRGPEGEGPGILPFALALWTIVIAAALSWFAYQRHPHVPDEVVYLLHARYFAAGLLELPLPPVLEAFDLDLMTVDPDRWFSPVPPGWPAMLAVGVWFGVPWLVNPLLGGAAVLLTYAAVRGVYDDKSVARLTVALLATSPWFIFMCMNFMTHTFTLVTALVGVWGTARMVRGGSWLWAIPAGIGIGLVALNRPLEGLIVAGLLGLWSLLAPGSPIRTAIFRSAALAGATLAAASITFPYNRHFTGRATHFPIMDYTDRTYGAGANAMGFGANRGLGWPGLDPFPGHGFIDVLVNGNLNLFQVNVELLGWGVGSVLVLALLVLGRRLVTGDHMMLAAVFAVIGAHSFYWFSGGPDFGARYWYLILVPCLALAARGIMELSRPDRAGGRIWPGMLVLVLGVVCVFLPWRAIDKYHHYRGMRAGVPELVASAEVGGDALVLVRGNRHPDYASAGIYNPLDLAGPGPLYVWDRDQQTRRAALEHYSDRPVWILEGPTVTGRGFELVEGPLDARQMLAAMGEAGR